MIEVLEQIKPETAARLAAYAQKQGLSIDDFIQSFLPAETDTAETKVELTPPERARLWREWVDNNSVKGVIADDSRESIYAPIEHDIDIPHFQQTATPEEWSKAFREWAQSHQPLPIIADDSRESIYEGRGE